MKGVRDLKRAIVGVTILPLTTLLLIGCDEETKSAEKLQHTEQKVNMKSYETKNTAATQVVTTASVAESPERILEKEAKAVKNRTLGQKAAYIIKKYPNDLEAQSSHMEGIAKIHKEAYKEEHYKEYFHTLLRDYEDKNYRHVKNRKAMLAKIYMGRLVTDYAQEMDLKVMYKFSIRYTNLLQDYYLGYNSKDNSRLKSYLRADKRSVDDAYRDITNLVQHSN